MATITDTTTDANGNIIVDVSSSENDSITLATAGNYSDKNIIFNLAIRTGAAEPVLQEKTVTFTENGTATITPDEGYDGLKKIDVTVDVASGGEGGAGFKVTFPATAKNWGQIYDIALLLSDGTLKPFNNYSAVGGQTIENVVGIRCEVFSSYWVLKMTLSKGKIAQTYPGPSFAIITAPAASLTPYGSGNNCFWWPLTDTVISAIEMYNTD